ncbi:TBC domain containing protein [Histomonas meleagridis]|uniref:TBC domain containing protein n=1 Tax=Histomonas meleagridis TaxID=135588 RepID=UPI00355955A8|nr:TBC domain containing protein [Histomonas meleagridis]KAH0797075.1 TBC domain containing protein [Histomonas meleagridis]
MESIMRGFFGLGIFGNKTDKNVSNEAQKPIRPNDINLKPNQKIQDSKIKEKNKIQQKMQTFESILSKPIADVEQLKSIAWNGFPSKYRPRIYRLLLDYEPINSEQSQALLAQKRKYYFDNLNRLFDPSLQKTWTVSQNQIIHQIQIDLPRTGFKLIHNERIQEIFKHVLFVWAIRHPASGYVQGMNDILAPFFLLFLTPYFPNDPLEDILQKDDIDFITGDDMKEIEADCFWCFNTMLDGIQDLFTKGQPGIFRMIDQLKTITAVVESELHSWLEKENVNYITFAFRWMNCLLVREFKFEQLFRIWDTLVCHHTRIGPSLVYLCASMLSVLAPKLNGLSQSEINTFIQMIPPEIWDDKIDELIAQAYVYEKMFPLD